MLHPFKIVCKQVLEAMLAKNMARSSVKMILK